MRFIGDVGYVVTFRQTDPLYTIDLSDPAAPRVAGELELLGYSAYLHPVGDGLLLGVGQDATAERAPAGRAGSRCSTCPTRRSRGASRSARSAPSSSADVEYDHHAFLWWPATKLAVLPVSGSDPAALGLRVGDGDLAPVGRLSHDFDAIQRVTVVGDRVYGLVDGGLVVGALDTLAERGFVDFPAS